MTNPHQAAETIKALARETGFDLAGITRAAPSSYPDAYRDWIAAGKHGAMEFLARGIDQRLDVTKKFPWAQSIVCVAMAYFQNQDECSQTQEGTGKIARYAWGRDYHKVIEAKLRQLERKIRATFEPAPAGGAAGGDDNPKLEIRAYCDTGPILERELAARAGLGWTGKNTLLIHPRHGSWFLLGELLLNLDLAPDSPLGDHCGTCRRCIEACPTNAITPYSVDATRCISYETLENRGQIAPENHQAIRDAGFIIGCDICQEVCPFNRKPLTTTEPDFAPRAPAPQVNLQTILAWHEQEWDILTRGRALRRAKFEMWKRNARIVAGLPLE